MRGGRKRRYRHPYYDAIAESNRRLEEYQLRREMGVDEFEYQMRRAGNWDGYTQLKAIAEKPKPNRMIEL